MMIKKANKLEKMKIPVFLDIDELLDIAEGKSRNSRIIFFVYFQTENASGRAWRCLESKEL